MRWSLYKEAGKWVIRRWYAGKYERMPVSRYKRIREDEPALRELVKRLNAPIDARSRVDFKHAFISPALLDEYLEYLVTQIPTESNARTEFGYLKTYFLNFFIGELNLMSPEEWHAVHETKWARYLLSDKAPASAKAKRDIIIAANRFIKWLNRKRPEDRPVGEFKPISKAKYKAIEAQREIDGEIRDRKIVPEKDFAKIISHPLAASIRSFIFFGYQYGLRRSETLGVSMEDVKRGHLCVERQLERLGVFAPLKGRQTRRVPHWFAKPKDAYLNAEAGKKNLIHPRTLSERWTELMQALGMDYDLHDLRHSFITRAVRLHNIRDVQLAAGHKDIRTTMGYLHDDRDLSDEQYLPEAG